MSDTGKIGTVLAWSLVDIFWSSMYVLGCVVIMLFVNWKLALILIAIIPIIAVITVVFQKKILAVNRRVRAINAEVTRHYNEGISGAKTSKTLVIEEKERQSVRKSRGGHALHNDPRRAVKCRVYSDHQLSDRHRRCDGPESGRQHGAVRRHHRRRNDRVHQLCFDYCRPVQQLARTISNFISTQVNIERVSALLSASRSSKIRLKSLKNTAPHSTRKEKNWEPIQGHITFDDVTFRYPDGVENVLEHFSLDIPAGTTVAIVGETGAGQSTLVNLACRFFEPTEGRILIDGKDYRERSMLWLHSSIGYVLQTPHLFPAACAIISATAA